MNLNVPSLLAAVTYAVISFMPASVASAQMNPPERRCAELMACESGEINHAYTVQYESGCGANCSIAYWVRDRDDGRVLVSVRDVPSATLGVRGFDREARPDVRIIAPRYGPSDPRCCPAGLADTRYVWNSVQGTLDMADERIIPTQDADFEALHAEMRDQGYVIYFDDRP
jgi:hypothetical protein